MVFSKRQYLQVPFGTDWVKDWDKLRLLEDRLRRKTLQAALPVSPYPTPHFISTGLSNAALHTHQPPIDNTMPPATSSPEQYHIKSATPYVPNSPLPVLIYRSCLPLFPSSATVCETIEPNNWLKGGVFKHYGSHHFHSVTHECYAVFKGHSKLLLGRGPLDPESDDDLIVDVNEGDAIVLPAGVAHCSLSSSDDYEYVGLYPKVCGAINKIIAQFVAPGMC